jgi:uncharacterized membrane protein
MRRPSIVLIGGYPSAGGGRGRGWTDERPVRRRSRRVGQAPSGDAHRRRVRHRDDNLGVRSACAAIPRRGVSPATYPGPAAPVAGAGAAFALSFVVLGQFWVSIHNQFRFIRRVDHWLIWLSITYLLFISLVPFTADHLGRYGALEPVVVLYGLNLLAVSVLQLSIWLWATTQRRLVDSDLASSVIRQGRSLSLIAVVGYAVAAATGPFAPIASVVIFLLIPLVNITGIGYRMTGARRGRRASSRL